MIGKERSSLSQDSRGARTIPWTNWETTYPQGRAHWVLLLRLARLPAASGAGTRQPCRGYRDIMTTTSDPAAYFGRQVRKERTARGWNLHEFGQMIAYHPAAISRVENGKRPPTQSFADQCDRVFPQRAGWFHEFFEESRGWLALPAWLRDWASHEQGTRILRDWCPSVVTGLLQT